MSLFDAIGTGLQVGVGDANLSFETRPETWPDPIRSGFSYVFERPDELVDGFEDTQDLPLGEVSDPLNLGGEDADKTSAARMPTRPSR